jgi:hypothetical protein
VLAADLEQLRDGTDQHLSDVLDALAIFPGARLAQLSTEEDRTADHEPTLTDHEVGAALLAFADRPDWPRVPLRPGLTILGSEVDWRTFLASGADPDHRAALRYLEALALPTNAGGAAVAPAAAELQMPPAAGQAQMDELGAALLDGARRHAWRVIVLSPGVSVGGDEAGWRRFAAHGLPDHQLAALRCLQALPEE